MENATSDIGSFSLQMEISRLRTARDIQYTKYESKVARQYNTIQELEKKWISSEQYARQLEDQLQQTQLEHSAMKENIQKLAIK